jgi:hypothetical protein
VRRLPQCDCPTPTRARVTTLVALLASVLVTLHCGTTLPTTPTPGATRLSFTTQPTGAQAGAAMTPAIQATVLNADGSVASSGVMVTLAITPGTGASGAVMGGTLRRPAIDGVATFSDLTIDKADTGYTLTATAPGLASATSKAFDVTAGPAARLVFSVEPTGVTARQVIAPALAVALQDAEGNTVPDASLPITLAMSAGTGTAGATLGGDVTRPAVDGVATFPDITVDEAGSGYTLTATADTISATSAPFDVSPWSGVATSISLQSDAGDYIGQGLTYEYSQASAEISVTAADGRLQVTVNGDQGWTGVFQLPSQQTRLEPGMYADLHGYPFEAATGGLSWSGEGRGCNTLTGWFAIDSVTYRNDILATIDLRFEQHCEGGGPALHGTMHWDPADSTAPPGPVLPVPGGLWQPAAGTTPTTGNFVYLESDAGDYVGQGQTLTYTQADAIIALSTTRGRLSLDISGDGGWSGVFQAMSVLSELQPGYYPNLQRYPFDNPTKGGLDWSGEGRGCNTLTGWFAIDGVTYGGGVLDAIDLRFEQHCEGGGPALHGEIHWTSNDPTQPPGPVTPIPGGLWQPASGATPASGNYVYLESETGDYIGSGQTLTYTGANATIAVAALGGHLSVSVTGNNTSWRGDFQAMMTLSDLEPGYYPDLERYPFDNPAKGGLSWSGNGRGCNTLTGWFAVDDVTYAGSAMMAIDLRFEQHCEGGTPALHGAMHWAAQ